MANHFPTIPTLNLSGIIYTAAIAEVENLTYFDVTGVQPMEDTLGPQIGAYGGTLADVQASINAQRQWLWQDSSGKFNLQYNGDTMTYPA